MVARHPIIEDAIDAWAPALADDRSRYRGHAYRVFNFARAILKSDRGDDALAVASAFHDIGIWSDQTFDYLTPSVARATEYLSAHPSDIPADLVADAITNHHVVLRIDDRRPDAEVVEAFRQADRVDVSAGLLRSGLDRGLVREVASAFPYEGFHGMLVRTAFRWMLRHPLRPLPMLRLAPAPPPPPAPASASRG